jgi:hypothetical protein
MKGFGATSYLIARRRPDSLHGWNQPYVTYTPPTAPGDSVWIGSYDDHTPHSGGSACSPQQFLDNPWLIRMLESLGGGWFLPFVRRLASGEAVPLEEIAAAYRQHNDMALEAKTHGQRFFLCEQFGYDWAMANPPLQTCLIDLIGSAINIADADWNAWKRGKAREMHRYIEAQYLQGKPCPPIYIANLPLRELAGCCIKAAQAAEREGVILPADRLTALKNPAIFGRGRANYQTLFSELI